MFTTVKKERKLKDQERYNRLHLDRAVENPHAYGRVIRMNSTYLEIVDYMYKKRGMMSFFWDFCYWIYWPFCCFSPMWCNISISGS